MFLRPKLGGPDVTGPNAVLADEPTRRAKPAPKITTHTIDIARGPNIQKMQFRRTARRGDVGGDCPPLLLQHIGYHDMIAGLAEGERRGSANPDAAAGDQNGRFGRSDLAIGHSITSPEFGPRVCPT